MNTDDVDLARRAAGGDRSAFEALYNRKSRLVWSVARARLTESAAEEVLQETFIQAHRNLKDFRGPNLNSWLCEICKNLCTVRLKRDGRREEVAPMVPLEYYRSGTGDDADRIIDRNLIRDALMDLSPDQRDALVKVRILGYEAKEVAAQRGVPASTVRSQVAAATRKLHAALLESRGDGMAPASHEDES
jgi:RNA polymerase sigma-70 factor (ECF subfamily)